MNKQKGIAPLLIVIIIALAVGGYLVYQKQAKPNPIPLPLPQQTTQPSPSPDASREPTGSAETANWKTYNSNLGYEFTYPKDWTSRVSSSGNIILTSPEKFGEVDRVSYEVVVSNYYKNPRKLGFKEFIIKELTDNGWKKDNSTYTTEQINNNLFYKLNTPFPSRSGELYMFIQKPNQDYIAFMLSPYSGDNSYPAEKKFIKIFNQILSTFKFQ